MTEGEIQGLFRGNLVDYLHWKKIQWKYLTIIINFGCIQHVSALKYDEILVICGKNWP